MDQTKRKNRFQPQYERLEVYLLAADNPIGKRQLRPIFRRKRSKQVLTREQVVAIKRGRRVLRKEMKERGLKRWIDFDQTATNLGLYFDRKGLLWPLILWFAKGNTVMKILATTTVLTTVMTVIEPVIEYVTEYVTQYVIEYVTEYVTDYLDKDRFTVYLSHDMLNTGFELSETPDFASPQQSLFALPVTSVPCISISQIPHNVDELPNNSVKDFFTYTFYCRYINKNAEKDMSGDLSQYAVNYVWGVMINKEGMNTTTNPELPEDPTAPTGNSETQLKVSDAIWVMVIQDGEAIVCARNDVDENGNLINQMIPTQEVLEKQQIAFMDRSIDYINQGLAKIDPALNVDNLHDLHDIYGSREAEIRKQVDAYFEVEGIQDLTQLMLRTENWRESYRIVGSYENYNYYQVSADQFVSDKLIAERTRKGVLPWIEGRSEEVHKYTVVIWLEGDDPQCKNELMDGFISLNFQIRGEDEEYVDTIITPTIPTIPGE